MCSIFDGSQSNRPLSEMNTINNVIDKSCFPKTIQSKKTNFRKIKLMLDLENKHQRLRIVLFDSPKSKGLKRCQKIPWGYSFGWKN